MIDVSCHYSKWSSNKIYQYYKVMRPALWEFFVLAVISTACITDKFIWFYSLLYVQKLNIRTQVYLITWIWNIMIDCISYNKDLYNGIRRYYDATYEYSFKFNAGNT